MFKILNQPDDYMSVSYFGRMLLVPIDTVAIATDEGGKVYAFDSIPYTVELVDESIWSSPGLNELITSIKYEGDWRESLFVLNAQNTITNIEPPLPNSDPA